MMGTECMDCGGKFRVDRVVGTTVCCGLTLCSDCATERNVTIIVETWNGSDGVYEKIELEPGEEWWSVRP